MSTLRKVLHKARPVDCCHYKVSHDELSETGVLYTIPQVLGLEMEQATLIERL